MNRYIPCYFLAFILVVECTPAHQEIIVPQVVQAKFNSLYPAVNDVNWEWEDGRYEAGFKINDTETSLMFSPDGRLFSIETEITTFMLPVGVKEYVQEHLRDRKIDEACKITDTSGTVNYEVKVGNDDYLFDGLGVFIRMEMEDNREENH